MKKPNQKRPRKRYTSLKYKDRFEIAYLYFFKGYKRKSLAYVYDISQAYLTKIIREFVKETKEWIADKPLPGQLGLKLKRPSFKKEDNHEC